MSGYSLRAELATAVRAVNAAYGALPEDRRPAINWNAVVDLLEDALNRSTREHVLEGIREWQKHWLSLFEEARR